MSSAAIGGLSDGEAFERCIAAGGVAVFPADTVYGLACDPDNRQAVERLYALKGRPLQKPSAVMFFDLEVALAALPDIGEHTRQAMGRLLPGAVGLLVPNPTARFPLAGGEDVSVLGLRVADVPRLAGVRRPVLQSSANLAGGVDPRCLDEVPEPLRDAADLVIDGGELPGTPSTMVDLRHYEEDGSWIVVRAGAVGEERLRDALGEQFHFHAATYAEEIRTDIPAYDRLQRELVQASGTTARRILELGTGTGETARRLLEHHPQAVLVGIDASEGMLAAARARLPADRAQLRVGQIEGELPGGPFDLVVSALAVHHLDGAQKARLFERVAAALSPGSRFVLADVVVPEDPANAKTPLTPGFDKPSSVAEQLGWLGQAGFTAAVAWEHEDLVVLVADAPAAGIFARRERRAAA